MIDGKRNGDAVPAEDSAGVATIRDDYLVGSDNGDDGGRADGVALWSLELAAAGVDAVASSAAAPVADILIHFRKALEHRLLPQRRAYGLELVFHDFMHPFSAPRSHLQLTNENRFSYQINQTL